MNYLEQLVAEWYEYQGYFVRRNVLVGKRAKGGHECELDVVAFHPATRHLVHVEPSMDASSWADREIRYARKFDAGRRHIPGLFPGLQLDGVPEQIALLEFASKQSREALGGGRLMLVSELLGDIVRTISLTRVASSAVPQQFAILRTIQFMSQYRSQVFGVPGVVPESP